MNVKIETTTPNRIVFNHRETGFEYRDINIFDENVNNGREILEILVLGKESRPQKIRRVLQLLRFPYIDIGKMRIPGKILPGVAQLLSQLSATAEYATYHEIGEVCYALPLLTQITHIDKPVNLSEISASDIYGELLASTLSPLNPQEQLELLVNGEIPFDFSRRNRYAKIQSSIINQYYGKKRGDSYGGELVRFYRNVLRLQIGFTEKQRGDFQLRMYDYVQNHFIRKNVLDLECIDYVQDVPKIIFNSDAILMGITNTSVA